MLSAVSLCAIARDFVLSDFLQRSVYVQIDMALNYVSRLVSFIVLGAFLCKHGNIFANGMKTMVNIVSQCHLRVQIVHMLKFRNLRCLCVWGRIILRCMS